VSKVAVVRKLIAGLVTVGLLASLLISEHAGRVSAIQGGDVPVDRAAAYQVAPPRLHNLQGYGDLPLSVQEPGEALAGRLGGMLEGFVDAYGSPVLYLGPNLVGFEVEDEGRAIVAFTGDRATRIVVVPNRPDDKPSTEPDPGDWSLNAAETVAQRFLPLDAELAEARSAAVAGDVVLVGCSDTLRELDDDGERDSGAAYSVLYTMPTGETVSAVTITLGDAGNPGGAGPSSAPADAGGADEAGASTSRAVSEQNGIRVTFLGFERDADVSECPALGNQGVAVEVAIENRSDETLRYGLDDFHVTDMAGRAYAAVEGGVDPAITRGALAPGNTIRGWISFRVPADAEPEWFVYTRDGATMRFGLS
jgi:hypothetical protein